jgi:outer membrane protein
MPIISLLLGVSTASLGWAESARDNDISRLLTFGQVDAARAILEASDPTPADRLFFDARLLKSQAKLTAAIVLFRQVLRIEPNRMNARRELAHTLLLNRDFRLAEFHFKQLLRIDENPKMRDGYRRFLAMIRRNKPFGVSGYFSMLPSTNVNRGTAESIFQTLIGEFAIDESSQATSGFGLLVGFSGFARHSVSTDMRLAINWGLFAGRYETESFGYQGADLAFVYERAIRTGRWTISPYLRKIWRPENASDLHRGLRLGVGSRLTLQDQLDISLVHEQRNYSSQPHLDGPFVSLSLSLSLQLSPSRSVQLGIGGDRSSPQSEHLRYAGTNLSLGIKQDWQGGLQTGFGFELGQRDFLGNYPLTHSPRADEFHRVNASLQHARIEIAEFRPSLSCSHQINRSNVAFYDYKVTECRITVSRNF